MQLPESWCKCMVSFRFPGPKVYPRYYFWHFRLTHLQEVVLTDGPYFWLKTTTFLLYVESVHPEKRVVLWQKKDT